MRAIVKYGLLIFCSLRSLHSSCVLYQLVHAPYNRKENPGDSSHLPRVKEMNAENVVEKCPNTKKHGAECRRTKTLNIL
ncbi:hypothetical protein Y032_0232g3054 [Ancylostoma ceylanicum]|uniref:Secreted protein n=1 Tax=Ancylostoma ceylanicum TaxID=53326 RepID=A0A016SFQ0_9BILA|nr:hypothetical protein Y032_0232g3054 [Ancylostoma ceylanicum]